MTSIEADIADNENSGQAISVSELNKRARQLLENQIGNCWVAGEISSLSRPQSGHQYFTLKDAQAQVRCAFFRQRAHACSLELRDGLQVQVFANVSLFEVRGDYQLIVESVRATGTGALLAALEALKHKLQNEGLFTNSRSLPYPPQHLIIITSPTGAAIRDVLTVLATRWPWIKVSLISVQVQGEQAAGQIIQALQLAQQVTDADAILLTRGGGSLEDLWCFNDEKLARSIFASRIPVMTGIGHEIDFTLADFVADQRAPTPSAAAERLTPDQRDIRRTLAQLAQRLLRIEQKKLQNWQQQLDYLTLRLRHPRERLNQQKKQLKDLQQRLQQAIAWSLQQYQHQLTLLVIPLERQRPQAQTAIWQQKLDYLSQRLQQQIYQLFCSYKQHWQQLNQHLLSVSQLIVQKNQQQLSQLSQRLQIAGPNATLARGYAVITNQQGEIIRQSSQAQLGELLQIKLNQGMLLAEVKAKN